MDVVVPPLKLARPSQLYKKYKLRKKKLKKEKETF